MKVFSTIRHTLYTLGSDQVEVRTHYFLFNWNVWTSKRQEALNQPQDWLSLKQDAQGDLVVGEQAEYLGLIRY